jgi:hypothetical protein
MIGYQCAPEYSGNKNSILTHFSGGSSKKARRQCSAPRGGGKKLIQCPLSVAKFYPPRSESAAHPWLTPAHLAHPGRSPGSRELRAARLTRQNRTGNEAQVSLSPHRTLGVVNPADYAVIHRSSDISQPHLLLKQLLTFHHVGVGRP